MTLENQPVDPLPGGTQLPRVALGRTRLELTRVSFGCAPLGGLFAPVPEAVGRATLEAAWLGGIRSFDVAPIYGNGLAERRVGSFLATKPRDSFVLSTKVGRRLLPGRDPDDPVPPEGDGRPVYDYSRDGILASLEASLERLGLDRVDIALIHDPDDHFEQALSEAYPTLEELRAAGTVGAIGFGMNQAEMLTRFVSETDIDCVLMAGRYSLLDDRGARSLLPAAAARGISVLAAGIFNSGVLADPQPDANFDYRLAPQGLIARARAIAAIAADHGVPLPRAALQFPLRHPAVTAVIVGMRSPAEVTENLANFWSTVPEGLWADLEASGLLDWHVP